MPPRTLPGSIERHREVCRKSELSSPSSELRSPNGSNCSNGFILLNDEFIKRPRSPVGNGFILQNDEFIKRPKSPLNLPATPFGIKISIAAMDNIMNNRNKHKINNELKMNLQNKRHSQLSDRKAANSDEDRFSDDSLEETSLPPPPAPAPVPPPPSLSCPVTPSKRHSIAWEVNLDDLTTNGNGIISSKVSFSSRIWLWSYLVISPPNEKLICSKGLSEIQLEPFSNLPTCQRIPQWIPKVSKTLRLCPESLRNKYLPESSTKLDKVLLK